MNGFLEVGTIVSVVLMAVFIVAGMAVPFVSHERKVRR
jgi:hypothetical protein